MHCTSCRRNNFRVPMAGLAGRHRAPDCTVVHTTLDRHLRYLHLLFSANVGIPCVVPCIQLHLPYSLEDTLLHFTYRHLNLDCQSSSHIHNTIFDPTVINQYILKRWRPPLLLPLPALLLHLHLHLLPTELVFPPHWMPRRSLFSGPLQKWTCSLPRLTRMTTVQETRRM